MKQVGTAIIGIGNIGALHADWLSQIPESNFVAVCDSRPELVRKAEKKYGVKGYLDYHDLLENKDVEAVIIATRHAFHSKMAIDTAKAGKHVAVEKPISLTLKEADDMIRAVKKARVKDLYMENLCFTPSFKIAKDIVDSGALGDVYWCHANESTDLIFGSEQEREAIEGNSRFSWYNDYSQTGGGELINVGVHPLQWVRSVFDGEPVQKVYAEIWDQIGKPKPEGIEDAALVTMKYKGGKIGQVFTSKYVTVGIIGNNTGEIYGNKGTITLDLYNRNPLVVHSHVGYDIPYQGMVQRDSLSGEKGWSFPMPEERYMYGYYQEQRHFLQSILADKRPVVNLDDGRATLEIVLAAYESHKTGNPVHLPLR